MLQYASEACCRVFMPRGDLACTQVAWRACCLEMLQRVGEPCCEHGRKYQDLSKGFDTIFREDLLGRQKIGIYSQNIIDRLAIYRLIVINRQF